LLHTIILFFGFLSSWDDE